MARIPFQFSSSLCASFCSIRARPLALLLGSVLVLLRRTRGAKLWCTAKLPLARTRRRCAFEGFDAGCCRWLRGNGLSPSSPAKNAFFPPRQDPKDTFDDTWVQKQAFTVFPIEDYIRSLLGHSGRGRFVLIKAAAVRVLFRPCKR